MHVIHLLYPGRRSNEWGCDFQDAIFSLDGERIIGDVEIHVEAKDWYIHRHNRDEKYSRVRLHVVWSNSDKLEITDCNGRKILTIVLEPYFRELLPLTTAGISSLQAQICLHALNFKLKERRLYEILLHLGIQKFEEKAQTIREQFYETGLDQTLYSCVAHGLGYSRNSLLFDKLTSYITIKAITSQNSINYEFIKSILLGTCGFLPSQRNISICNEYLQRLESIWFDSGYTKLIDYYDWNFRGVRPSNYPVRRVVALSYFALNLVNCNLSENLLDALIDSGIHGVRSLMHKYLNYEQEKYWTYHYDFNCNMQKETALVGASRIDDIIINIILPYLYGCTGSLNKPVNVNRLILDSYVMYPSLQSNYIDRYMSRLLPICADFKRSAVLQQGLLYLFKKFCRYKLCNMCPIIN